MELSNALNTLNMFHLVDPTTADGKLTRFGETDSYGLLAFVSVRINKTYTTPKFSVRF